MARHFVGTLFLIIEKRTQEKSSSLFLKNNCENHLKTT